MAFFPVVLPPGIRDNSPLGKDSANRLVATQAQELWIDASGTRYGTVDELNEKGRNRHFALLRRLNMLGVGRFRDCCARIARVTASRHLSNLHLWNTGGSRLGLPMTRQTIHRESNGVDPGLPEWARIFLYRLSGRVREVSHGYSPFSVRISHELARVLQAANANPHHS
jgi:hypothetical protein